MDKHISPDNVFTFALRVFYHLHPNAVGLAKDDKTYDTVREILSGETCLWSSPQEMARVAAEHVRPEVTEHLQRNIGKAIERDKRIAKMVLESM